jgi:predicted O-methyltransferase YrrM
MRRKLRPKDRKQFIRAIAVTALLFLAAHFWGGGVTAGEIVLGVLILALGLQLFVLRRDAQADARQQAALMSLLAVLRQTAPLPDMEHWSATPDFLKKLLELVLVERPVTIVEAGSGTSTLVCAAALRQLGRGKVISLEHEESYAQETRALLDVHGLAEHAQVFHAPLVEQDVGGKRLRWYDLSGTGIPRVESIDLLLIDGPPRDSGPLARYPALPLLHRQLRGQACVLLDDAARPAEREAVRLWLTEFPDLAAQDLRLAKGGVLLRKAGNDPQAAV